MAVRKSNERTDTTDYCCAKRKLPSVRGAQAVLSMFLTFRTVPGFEALLMAILCWALSVRAISRIFCLRRRVKGGEISLGFPAWIC